MKLQTSNIRLIWVVLFLISPSICDAAAPVYFDIGGGIRFVLFYIIGFALIIAWVLDADGNARNSAFVVLCLYVISPFVLS